MLSGVSIEGARDDCEDGSKDIEWSELGSSDDMCGRDEDVDFEGISLYIPCDQRQRQR